MKISHNDVQDLHYALSILIDALSNESVIPGCECGCGGDYIDFKQEAERVVSAKEVLNKYGLEYERD